MTSLVCAKQLVLLTNFGSCKKVGPWKTRCVHKVGSYQISLVRATGYLMTSLGTCKTAGPLETRYVKVALIRPARYMQESWLSYDQLGTCKTAGPLDQLRFVQKSWSLANSVRA